MVKEKMNKYRILYIDGNSDLVSIEIEASGIGFDTDRIGESIIFFDEYGENGYEFYKKDVIRYYKVKESSSYFDDHYLERLKDD